jgi:hypothetical protein
MVKLRKIIFKKLEDPDLDKLKVFCAACEKLGYVNNSNFQNIKLNQMHMPYGQFFVGIDTEKDIIFTIGGVHQMFEINQHAWRCVFRGATLPGYTTGVTGTRACYPLIYILNLQIDFILSHDANAKFYITTNHSQEKGKSARMNNVYFPKMEKQGVISLEDNGFIYNHTLQRLWKINVDAYKKWRVF